MRYLIDTLVAHPFYFIGFMIPICFFLYSFVWCIGKYRKERDEQKRVQLKYGLITYPFMTLLFSGLFFSFSFFKWNSSWSGVVTGGYTMGGDRGINGKEGSTETYHIKLSSGQNRMINRRVLNSVAVGDSIVKVKHSYILIVNGEELRHRL